MLTFDSFQLESTCNWMVFFTTTSTLFMQASPKCTLPTGELQSSSRPNSHGFKRLIPEFAGAAILFSSHVRTVSPVFAVRVLSRRSQQGHKIRATILKRVRFQGHESWTHIGCSRSTKFLFIASRKGPATKKATNDRSATTNERLPLIASTNSKGTQTEVWLHFINPTWSDSCDIQLARVGFARRRNCGGGSGGGGS